MTAMPEYSHAPYLTQRTVRFGDCDPAGIVFYPRYFEMLNGVIEDWWLQVGLSWVTELPARGIVTPISHLEAQFLRPSRHGDLLNITLTVETLRRSSMRLSLLVTGADSHDERLRARARMVCVSTRDLGPKAWPDDVQAMLAAHRQP